MQGGEGTVPLMGLPPGVYCGRASGRARADAGQGEEGRASACGTSIGARAATYTGRGRPLAPACCAPLSVERHPPLSTISPRALGRRLQSMRLSVHITTLGEGSRRMGGKPRPPFLARTLLFAGSTLAIRRHASFATAPARAAATHTSASAKRAICPPPRVFVVRGRLCLVWLNASEGQCCSAWPAVGGQLPHNRR